MHSARLMKIAALGAVLACACAYGADDRPPPIDAQPQNAAPANPPGAAAEPADWTPVDQGRPEPSADVRIEQKHVGRRVSEWVVTPAGFTYHYTIEHLDDQDPGTLMQPHPQLSVPNFVRFDFNF